MMTTTEVFDEAALANLIAAATILGADVKMGLNTALVTPSKVLAIADMAEPTYGSYVRQSVVFGAPFRDLTYEIASLAGAINWQQTGTAVPCLIQGYFLTYGAGPTLLAYESLSTPFQMNDLLDAIAIQVEYIQTSGTPGFANVAT